MYLPIKIVAGSFIFAALLEQSVEAKTACSGTFSSLHFNRDGGDVLGVEIRIVGTQDGKQAVVQFSEGEPSKVVVTPVECNDSKVFFKIGKENGRAAVTFDGIVSNKRLAGVFVYENGNREKVSLMRRKSYWD